MKRSTTTRIAASFIALSLLPFSALFSLTGNLSHAPTVASPKRLLTGSEAVPSGYNGIWSFYNIGNLGNEYAVALKDTYKTKSKGELESALSDGIPTVFPGTTKQVTAFWASAFNGCKFESFTIPSHIKTIDCEAFMYSNITDIIIPTTVTQIGESAFYACPKLKTVHFASAGEGSSSSTATKCDTSVSSGCPVPTVSSTPSARKNLEIEDTSSVQHADATGITIIPAHCFFKCSALEQVDFPDTLQEVSYEAFNGCISLKSDLFFKSILRIRARAFQGCNKLKKAFISSSLFEDSSNSGIEPHAFNYCNSELDIYFCGKKTKVENWVSNGHTNWGVFNDRDTPSNNNRYTYLLLDGNTGSDSDWGYTYDGNEVTIVSYRGKWDPDHGDKYICIKDKIAGKDVVRISTGAFSNVADKLERLYLPTTLAIIENYMFDDSFKKLYVIKSNVECCSDLVSPPASNKGEIDLHSLTELEFIGTRAFAEMHCRNDVTKLHLPARIRAIGDEAFCIKEKGSSETITPGKYHFKNLRKFLWDYSEEPGKESRLECVGNDAFFKLGVNDENAYSREDGSSGRFISVENILAHDSTNPRTLSTIIFPKTLRYFGLFEPDISRFSGTGKNKVVDHPFDFKKSKHTKYNRPGHTFALCPLIKKVIFKGSTRNNDGTLNEDADHLIIPSQCFWGNQSLQTVIIEERLNKTITFHSQSGAYTEGAFAACGGRLHGDFRGTPGLQTIVLPNQCTNLGIQRCAFMGNPRATMYFSGEFWERDADSGELTGKISNAYLKGNKYFLTNDGNGDTWGTKDRYIKWNLDSSRNVVFQSFTGDKAGDINDIDLWRSVGDESFFTDSVAGAAKLSGKNRLAWTGYCFAYDNTRTPSADQNVNMNTFFLDQKIPVEENVHYKEDVYADYDATKKITTVEVGTSGSGNKELAFSKKCAFVCDAGESSSGDEFAKMTRYLYDLWDDEADHTTAVVPSEVTVGSTTYTVNEIGDSAFTACYSDGTDGGTTNLTKVMLPDEVTKIGEYAFFRAYSVENVMAYTGTYNASSTTNPTTGTNYSMPSKLRHIGKNAFSFCGIKECLNIPYECIFYENEFHVCDVTSVFSNSFDLRWITFLGEGANPSQNQTASKFYETREYTSSRKNSINSSRRTVSLYSREIIENTNDDVTWYNDDGLLLVLNRDIEQTVVGGETIDGDKTKETSGGVATAYETTKIKFDGSKVGSKPFLFGAYKMGYWIDSLTVGPYAKKLDGATRNTHPLISGVCNRADKNKDCTAAPMYLDEPAAQYRETARDISASGFSVVADFMESGNSFAYCPDIKSINLPNAEGAVLADGMFAGNNNTSFKTDDGNSYGTGDKAGKLDLSGTGYAGIGSQTFAGITTLKSLVVPTTPSGKTFTIGASAFSGCTNLASIDFSTIHGTLVLSDHAFDGCTSLTSITWPTDGTVVVTHEEEDPEDPESTITVPNTGIFHGCTSLTTLNFTLNGTSVLGAAGCFQGCTSLKTVNVSGTGDSPITRIESYAFEGCTSLTTFPFDRFGNVESIGQSAFKGCFPATDNNVATNIAITLPASVTSLEGHTGSSNPTDENDGCFSSTGLKGVIFSNDSSTITFGKRAFYGNTNLAFVRFAHGATVSWGAYSGSIFSGCTSLTELQLPEGFALDNTSTDSIVWGDSNAAVYSYKTYTLGAGTGSVDKWNKITSTNSVPLYWYAGSMADLTQGTIITYNENNGTYSYSSSNIKFWTLGADGSAIALGTVVSCTPAGLVTFLNGSTMDASGNFTHPNS